MEKNDWIEFKTLTEKKFESAIIEKCWGFQIQKHTKWNKGLTKNEIANLEQQFGFKFPIDYVEMLQAFNGFDTLQIAIDPEGKEEAEYERRCYMYPNDFEKTKWLIDEVNQNIECANEVLKEAGFDSRQIEGFIPLYGHRALVVLKDKQQSPVLSIWGNDIIIYGESLINYWRQELYIY
jgi:hypothetical protein